MLGASLFDSGGKKIRTVKCVLPLESECVSMQPFYSWDDDGAGRAENVEHRECTKGTEH